MRQSSFNRNLEKGMLHWLELLKAECDPDKHVNTKNPPAGTLVVVKGLYRPDLLIEVEATAIIPK